MSAPVITQQPVSTVATVGGSATFSVVATTDAGTLTYQWYKGASALTGQTGSSLTISPVMANTTSGGMTTPGSAGFYNVVVGNTSGLTTSSSANLVVHVPTSPAITVSPLSTSVRAGSNAVLNVVASSPDGAMTYQWFLEGNSLGASLSGYTGTQTSALTIVSATAASGGNYTVGVTNVAGTTTSAVATVTVVQPTAPVITSASALVVPINYPLTYQIAADNLPTSFNATGLPTGLSVDTSTGIISGSLATAGTYAITISATNTLGTGTGTLAVTASTSAVAPYSPGYTPPSTGGNFYQPTGGTRPGAPIALGSAALAKATPIPGATLSVNEFGLDVQEREWMCPTASAASIKPNIRDADPYLVGLNCVSSTVVDGEARMSTIRATYKGLVDGIMVRPAERTVSTNTDRQTVTVQTSTTSFSGGGSGAFGGGGGATVGNYRTVPDIPVPQPVFSLRGAAATEPSLTALGQYFPNPIGVPTVAPTFVYAVYAQLGLGQPFVQIGTMTFAPEPRGWLCDRLDIKEAGLHFEYTQQWTLKYILTGFSLPAL